MAPFPETESSDPYALQIEYSRASTFCANAGMGKDRGEEVLLACRKGEATLLTGSGDRGPLAFTVLCYTAKSRKAYLAVAYRYG